MYILNDYDGAIQDFIKVTVLQPYNSNVWYNLGVIYASRKNSNEAIKAYWKYIALEPKEWHGYKNIADVYYVQLAKYDSSAFYYNKAWEINKKEKEIIERYGFSLVKQNKIKEAVDMFNNQVSFLPDDPWGYYNIASAYSVGKQPKPALTYFELAIKKRMSELGYWQSDKNLDNIRLLADFKKLIKKNFTRDELVRYPKLFGF